MQIENLELDEWLSQLKPYQKEVIKSLIEAYGEEEALDKWLESYTMTPQNMDSFGGTGGGDSDFIKNLKKEINKFICGHPDYEKEGKEFKDKIITPIFIGGISKAIGAITGIAVTAVFPAVAVVLYLAGKIGKSAYCETYYN